MNGKDLNDGYLLIAAADFFKNRGKEVALGFNTHYVQTAVVGDTRVHAVLVNAEGIDEIPVALERESKKALELAPSHGDSFSELSIYDQALANKFQDPNNFGSHLDGVKKEFTANFVHQFCEDGRNSVFIKPAA